MSQLTWAAIMPMHAEMMTAVKEKANAGITVQLGAATTVTHGLALLRLSCRARLSQRRAGGSGSRAALLGRSRGPWLSRALS